jgi:CRP-like cAMP-binding protein
MMTSQVSPLSRRVQPVRLLEPAALRLNSLAPLSGEEMELVYSLEGHVDSHAPGRELVVGDATTVRALVVVDGWACRQRVLPDGRRQIFSFLLPGDAIGLSREPGPHALSPTMALTRLTTVQAGPLRTAAIEAPERWPGLALALRRAEQQDEAQLLDHLTRLGRQSAYERVAHLLLELQARLDAAGLTQNRSFPLPLTQETMADALGLSIVHVNRVLQQLRRERLIELRGGRATLLQPDLLSHVADFAGAV